MAKTTENTPPSTDSNQKKDPQAAAAQQQGVQVEVDDSNTVCSYANFCRVTGAFEELIIDFGLSTQPAGSVPTKITIDQRIVLNYYTAKRMLHALNMSIQRHESVFGVLETDIQKRVQRTPGSDGAS